jgi:hypothetical protein
VLPRTRYRFGRALAGRPHAGQPPNPTLPTRQNDPLRAAVGILRSVGMLRRDKSDDPARQAQGSIDDPSAGASDLPSDSDHQSGQSVPPRSDKAGF